MKTTTLFLAITFLFLMGCNKDDGIVTCFFGIERYFYIEITNAVGEIPENGDVSILYPAISFDLIELAKVDEDTTGKTIFGLRDSTFGTIGIYFSVGDESKLSQNVDSTETLYIHYNDNSSDTLTIRKFGLKGDSELTFDFRLNGNLLDTTPIFGSDVYFSIVKDIEWKNMQVN
jgi:hypothetical protein